jgi:hypothetical protein
MNDPILVTCVDCGRQIPCIRVKDGTLYRPLAWTFSDAHAPFRGTCSKCQRMLEILPGAAVILDDGRRIALDADSTTSVFVDGERGAKRGGGGR